MFTVIVKWKDNIIWKKIFCLLSLLWYYFFFKEKHDYCFLETMQDTKIKHFFLFQTVQKEGKKIPEYIF